MKPFPKSENNKSRENRLSGGWLNMKRACLGGRRRKSEQAHDTTHPAAASPAEVAAGEARTKVLQDWQLVPSFGCGSKIGTQCRTLVTWKHGLKPAVRWWLNFDPDPFVHVTGSFQHPHVNLHHSWKEGEGIRQRVNQCPNLVARPGLKVPLQ